MFFYKTENTNLSAGKNIVIIGTSALALYLADLLQRNGNNIKILVAPHLLASYSHLGAFSIKTPSSQNRHANYSFASSLQIRPDFCFLASSPESWKTDLLFLKDDSLQNVPLFNLSSFYNKREMAKINGINFINAYFDGLLSLKKATIHCFSRYPKIEICTTAEITAEIKKIFPDTSISVNFSKDTLNLFWKHFAIFFLTHLLRLQEDNIPFRPFSQNTKKTTEQAAAELCNLAKNQKIILDGSELLANIGTFSEDWHSELSSRSGVGALSSMIEGISPFETPTLFSLLAQAAKKY